MASPAHGQLAHEAARQSIVLFKNVTNTLPLVKSSLKKIAVIGPMADVCQLGSYSGAPRFLVSPLQGITEYLGIPSGPSYHKRADEFTDLAKGLELEACNEGGEDLRSIRDGSWASYSSVQFTGASEFHARVTSNTGGGTIEVHLDSLDGPVISELRIQNTGPYRNWENVSASLKPVSGEHKVFLHFTGGPGDLFSFQSFKLTPSAPIPGGITGTPTVAYAQGCTVLGDKDAAQFDEAVAAARESDVALVFVGADRQVSRESHDRSYIDLPGVQHELVQAVYAANPRTILIISSIAPVAVNWEQENLPAIVGGFFLGEQQGRALAEVLFGDYNPGGKVSTTWYRRIEDLPDFHDYNIRHGRTYLYFRGSTLYPFGHGLSYTTFQYKNLRLSGETLQHEGKVTVSFDVTNSGPRDGDEIVQLYVRCAGGTVERPLKQLANFERLHLKAGETGTVSFELPHEHQALQYWDENKAKFVVESGALDVMIGASSRDIRLRGTLQVTD